MPTSRGASSRNITRLLEQFSAEKTHYLRHFAVHAILCWIGIWRLAIFDRLNFKDKKMQAGRTGPVQSHIWDLHAAGKASASPIFLKSWKWLILAYRAHRSITFFISNFSRAQDIFKTGILPPCKLFRMYFGSLACDLQESRKCLD